MSPPAPVHVTKSMMMTSSEQAKPKIALVVPFDYLSLYSGSVQRVKADLAALMYGDYNVEMILPARVNGPADNGPSGLTTITYPNIQRLTILPEKVRLLFDMYTQMLNPFFRSTLRKRYGGYSIIFAHFPWSLAASHRVVKGKIPLIYVAHDFEYGLIRQATHNPLIRKLTYHVEKSACHSAAKILCVSEPDMKALQTAYEVPAEKFALLPNTVDTDYLGQTRTLYDRGTERRKLGLDPSSFLLLFHGRMDYRPNLHALSFILNELVPALKECGDNLRLIVAGARIPRWSFANRDETISFYSDVPDMRRFLAVADAVIVPLSMGGGTRLKILESFAARVPVISTAKGAEGIDCEDGHHLLIARSTAADFATKIKILAASADLRQQLADNAYDLVSDKYSIPVASRCLQDIIAHATAQEI
jgi:glycosyltransferase involved in cell wall biosynthesis